MKGNGRKVNLANLKFDDNGLIPAVVQDYYTNEVLMVAYMNEDSLQISLSEGITCFWSRSRNELWRKGETSGNSQQIVSIDSDCDSDTLLIKVIKDGPACHTGSESCFFNELYVDESLSDGVNADTPLSSIANANETTTVVSNIKDTTDTFSMTKLYELLLERKGQLPEGSYTTYLFEKGTDKILKKIGEENAEVIIAAMKNDKQETIFEISDLTYHVLVLMVSMGITLEELIEEISSRHIIDHKVKQETMK